MYVEEKEICLCDELVKAMTSLQFKEDSINYVKNNGHYLNAKGKHPIVQKTMLTMTLSNVFLTGRKPAPIQVRLHLNLASNYKDWLKDIQLVILPFLKLNEDQFFVDLFI